MKLWALPSCWATPKPIVVASFASVPLRSPRMRARHSTHAIDIGQVVGLPIDLNGDGYIRQSGNTDARVETCPGDSPAQRRQRIHLTRKLRADDGVSQGSLLWIDLAVPTQTAPGDYRGSIELLDASGRSVVASLPIRLTIHDLVLPDQRSSTYWARRPGIALERHFRSDFEAITPKLLNRTDARYRKPIAVLDSLVTLRAETSADAGGGSIATDGQVESAGGGLRDYDSVVGPWLDGLRSPTRSRWV